MILRGAPRTSTTFVIGDRTIHRMGYGAAQLTGPGTWGPPADRPEAVRILRRAVELGADFIDTADSYGPALQRGADRRGPPARTRRSC